jgi:methyl-accepting chemotaxis protein
MKDYSDRQYYQDVMAGKELTWQTLIGKTSKRPAIVLAIPIKRDGKTVGVLANAMRTDVISKRIATWKRGSTGFAFLVDETGKVVAHQVKAYVTQERNLSQHPLVAALESGREGVLYFKDQKDAEQIGNVRRTRYGWAMAIQQSSAEAFDILQQERRFAYLVLGVTVFCVLLIAWMSGRSIVSPIKKLTDAADRISVGELDVEVKIKSKDEIAALGEAISRMQDSIRLSIERLRRRKRAG